MENAILRLFKQFKFARKRIGGTWYFVEVPDSGTGFAGHIEYWTQNRPDDDNNILKTESY